MKQETKQDFNKILEGFKATLKVMGNLILKFYIFLFALIKNIFNSVTKNTKQRKKSI